MNSTQEHWWKLSLRLKLRESSGDAFQDFFSDVMQKVHGDDFVRVRPFGQKGDKGCDGYLQSTGQVYQCYGALNGDKGKVAYLISKMEEDFAKAKNGIGAIMKEWYMVHNLIDGLPVEAVETLEKLRDENRETKFGFIGLEGFEQRVGRLEKSQIEEILGPVATNHDSQNLQVAELRDLISGVIEATEKSNPELTNIDPVPADKLDANDLPEYWKTLISSGWQNAYIVADYIDNHHDPLIGETIAEMFNVRYKYLKAQDLTPASIMDGLYVFVTGIGSVAPARQVAAMALLAHLFESCDIFENVSVEDAP